MQLIDDFLHLLYPSGCFVCEKELSKFENHLCSFCLEKISLTNFHLFEDATSMDKLFWGRIKINKSYSHLFFEKNKVSQSILFSLKYKKNPSIGIYFGEEIGKILHDIPELSNVDAILPVPLHPKKQFSRGYNQSEMLAKGIATTFPKKLDVKSVVRSIHSETQTKKTRFQRWDNVSGIFFIKNEIKHYQHILIVDDVITTGSTIEAMANAILSISPTVLISVATLAIAK